MKLGALACLAWVALAACGDDGAATVDAPVAIDAGTVDADPTDAAGTCSRDPCSILPQCGCDDTPATPACDLDFVNPANGDTRCRADTTQATEATVCMRASGCAAESTCLNRCRKYCDHDSDCSGPGGLCIVPILFNSNPVPGVKVCTTDCEPTQAANNRCPPAWGCHLYRETDGDLRYLTDCEAPPVTGGQLGDACTANKDCGPALDCFNDGSGMGRRCTPNCLCPGGNCAMAVCPAGTGTCHPYATAATIGPRTYGRCFQ